MFGSCRTYHEATLFMNKSVIGACWILCGALPLAACSEGDPADGPPSEGTGATGIYALDVPESFWTDPPGIGADIGAFVPEFLFDVSGTTVTLGTAHQRVQDQCTPTAVVQATVAPPQFVLGPMDYEMHLENAANQAQVNTTIRALTITNVIPPTDDAGGTLSAVLDAREIYPMFHLLTDPQPSAVCSALDEFDAPCEPCPQDGQPFCLTITATRLEAVPAPEIVMGPVDGAGLGAECADVVP